MRNRFNINESEKNRIRGLHGMQAIVERWDYDESSRKWEMAKNGKKWGTDTEDRLTQEFYNELKEKAGIAMANLGFDGKTINLYKQAAQDREGEVIGKYKIASIELIKEFEKEEISDEDWSWPIIITFVKEGATPTGNPTVVRWGHGGSCYSDNPVMKVISSDDFDEKVVINTQFTKRLQQKVCDFNNGFIGPYIEMRGLIMGGRWQIVEDADFASNDQGGDIGNELS